MITRISQGSNNYSACTPDEIYITHKTKRILRQKRQFVHYISQPVNHNRGCVLKLFFHFGTSIMFKVVLPIYKLFEIFTELFLLFIFLQRPQSDSQMIIYIILKNICTFSTDF